MVYTPNVQHLLPHPSAVAVSGVKRRAIEEVTEKIMAEATVAVPDGDQGATLVESKRSSERIAKRNAPLFVDMVAQASYLKAKKLGDAPPPPLTAEQVQVPGQECKLEKNKLDALKKASNKVPSGRK